ncbi:MAG TPA: hypothetical protein VG099_21135, partial [Gemmataceae bacterium]|nr:hypothetical protein [Gemmataceae bacterium]
MAKLLLILVALTAGLASTFQLLRYPARLRTTFETGVDYFSGFSRSGETFLNATDNEGGLTFRIWDLHSGKALISLGFKPTEIDNLAISPDGKFLALWDYDNGLKLWDVTESTKQIAIKNKAEPRFGRPELKFSPDSRLLAVTFTAPNNLFHICLLDTKTGIEVARFNEAPGALAFAPDGQLLAWATWDSHCEHVFLRLWSRETKHTQSHLVGQHFPISQLSFSPDGRVATGSYVEGERGKTEVRLWDAATLEEIARFIPCKEWSSIYAITFSPSGRLLMVDGDGKSVVWDVALTPPQRLAEFANTPVFTRDGAEMMVVCGEEKDVIELWDSKSLQRRATCRCRGALSLGSSWSAYASSISPDGKWVAFQCQDDAPHSSLVDWFSKRIGLRDEDGESMRLWDIKTNSELASFTGYQHLSFSPKGDTFAICSPSGGVKIWEL